MKDFLAHNAFFIIPGSVHNCQDGWLVALGVLLRLLVSLEWEQGDVAQRQHVVRALHRQLVLPLQVDRSVLLVRKPLLTQRALKPDNIIIIFPKNQL